MRDVVRAVPGGLRAATLLLLAVAAGCRSSSPLEGAGLALNPPADWRPVSATTWPVPGTALAAWSGPGGASLVAYRTLPAPGASPTAVAEELANRMEHLPGVRELSRTVATVAGAPAARVELVAPGDGASLAPTGMGMPYAPAGKGLVPTHRVCIAWPSPAGTTWLCWHYPESARSVIAPQIEATLTAVRLRQMPLSSSSY
jgi:hypothetical protein